MAMIRHQIILRLTILPYFLSFLNHKRNVKAALFFSQNKGVQREKANIEYEIICPFLPFWHFAPKSWKNWAFIPEL